MEETKTKKFESLTFSLQLLKISWERLTRLVGLLVSYLHDAISTPATHTKEEWNPVGTLFLFFFFNIIARPHYRLIDECVCVCNMQNIEIKMDTRSCSKCETSGGALQIKFK